MTGGTRLSPPDEVIVMIRTGTDVTGIRFEAPTVEIEERRVGGDRFSTGYDWPPIPERYESVLTVRGVVSWARDTLLPKLEQ